MAGTGGAEEDEPRRKRRRGGGEEGGGREESSGGMSASKGGGSLPSGAMPLEGSAASSEEGLQKKWNGAAACSICLDLVVDCGKRSIAKLHCGHEFHLDCIGSAFNAKGGMQCPNCRKVEKGQWLYASGHRSPAEFFLEGWMTDDVIDLNYPELPIGIHWCPLRGFTQLSSLFEDAEFPPNPYHDLLGTFGDHSSASSSTHGCPYLAVHGFPHAVPAAPATNTDPVPDSVRFHRHATSIGGPSLSDLVGLHSYPAIEPQNHNWQQHSHPFLHGSSARHQGNMATSVGNPVIDESRGGRPLRHGGVIYPQSVASAHHGRSHFPPPIRRPGPTGVVAVSSYAASSAAEPGAGFHGVSASSSVNRNVQDVEGAGGHFDRTYGWPGVDGYPRLPWIHVEGESQWWGPFNPSQNHPQQGSSDSVTRNFFPQGPTLEPPAAQSRQDSSSYLRLPTPRLPPFQ